MFLDEASIPGGVDFRREINDALLNAFAVVALIGNRWLEAEDGEGKQRLLDPDDYVRHELEYALECDLPVIPVLVRNASMPRSTDLPETLTQLSFRNAICFKNDPPDVADLLQLREHLIAHLWCQHEEEKEEMLRSLLTLEQRVPDGAWVKEHGDGWSLGARNRQDSNGCLNTALLGVAFLIFSYFPTSGPEATPFMITARLLIGCGVLLWLLTRVYGSTKLSVIGGDASLSDNSIFHCCLTERFKWDVKTVQRVVVTETGLQIVVAAGDAGETTTHTFAENLTPLCRVHLLRSIENRLPKHIEAI